MNYRDQWVTNEAGEKFVFRVEVQRKLGQAGLPVEPASIALLGEEAGEKKERERPSRSQNDQPKTERRSEPKPQPKPREEKQTYEMPEDIQIDPMTGKYIGRVKWYNLKKGYGFIMRGGGEEIFFHKSGAADDNTPSPQEGQWVLYDVEDTKKGPEATDVEAYEGEPPL